MNTLRFTGRWMVLAVALVSFIVAFSGFNPSPHTGGDNAGYLSLAYSIVSGSGYVELWDPETPIHTKYPPVYPFVLALAMLLGVKSWVAFKLLSVVFTTISLAIMFDWVRSRHMAGLALCVCSVLIFSPAILWSSNWILSDPLFLTLTLCCFWAFGRWEERGHHWSWLFVGCSSAILALFTRTAGIPIVLGIVGTLALKKQWKILAIFLFAVTLPSLAWLSFTQGAPTGQYVSEFFLVDPYQPELGGINVLDFLTRILTNMSKYIFLYFPQGLSSWSEGGSKFLGPLVFLTASIGWFKRLRYRAGVSEFFFPLYLLLILSWPVVWSGDRFALPLYPLILLYAGDAIAKSFRTKSPWLGIVSCVSLVLLFLVPSVNNWYESTGNARECRRAVSDMGSFSCYNSGFQEFVSAAEWLGDNVPEGSAVFSRKPRIFYTLSGVQSRTYPFSQDYKRFLKEADERGIRYVVLDRLDRLGETYVGSVVRFRPEAFCSIGIVGNPSEYTAILGIRGGNQFLGDHIDLVPASEGLQSCPSGFLRDQPIQSTVSSNLWVPILADPLTEASSDVF